MDTISPIKFDSVVNDVIETLPKRTKTVVVRRFGLKNGKRETLEAIGKEYGITRERVRQIENDALKQLRKSENVGRLAPAMQYLEDHFREYGNVRAEHAILQHLAEEEHPHPKRQAILLVLTVGEPFERESESDEYHAHWFTEASAKEQMSQMLARLVERFEEGERRLWSRDELVREAANVIGNNERAAEAYLDVSKEITGNSFGEYGLAEWPEVSPRGVRDKAYLVLRRETKPLHFTDITSRINDARFSNRKAYVQTVHNELIKDKRFVLVGRGLYALDEWGYKPGTVLEVLRDIINERGPLTKEEALQEALKRRMVRANTVILNLQNPKVFIRTADNKYALAEA